jgi:hypothetical protein
MFDDIEWQKIIFRHLKKNMFFFYQGNVNMVFTFFVATLCMQKNLGVGLHWAF